jgi:hypothetical protein
MASLMMNAPIEPIRCWGWSEVVAITLGAIEEPRQEHARDFVGSTPDRSGKSIVKSAAATNKS